MPPKRGKKGKRRGDESSDDDAAAIKAASKSTPDPAVSVDLDSEDDVRSGKTSAPATHATQAGAAARKAKKKKGKGARANIDDSDDEDMDALDPLAHLRGGGRKGQLAPTGSDDETDRPKKPLTKKEKRKLEEEQRKRELEAAAQAVEDEEDDDKDEDEDDADEGGKGDEDEPESGARQPKETMAAPTRKAGNKKKKGKGGRRNFDDDDDDDDDGVDALDPLAHLRGKGGGGGRKGALGRGDTEGDEDDDAGDRPKKPLTRKEKKRLEEEQQRQREREVDERVLKMTRNARRLRVPVTGDVISSFGRTVKKQLLASPEGISEVEKNKLEEFMASPKWKDNLVKRNGLVSKTLHGEAGGVDHDAAREGMDAIREAALNFHLDHIFNVDETRLFFKDKDREKDENGGDEEEDDDLGGKADGGEGDEADEDDRPKKPLTKKERRRLEEQERLKREAAAVEAEQSRADEDEGDDDEAPVPSAESSLASGISASKKGGKKGNKKGRKGAGRDDAEDDDEDNLVHGDSLAPATGGKLSKKERRRAEAEAAAAAAAAAAAIEDEEEQVDGDDDDDGDDEESAAAAAAEPERAAEAPAAKSRKGDKKGKKGKKGRGRDDAEDDEEDELSSAIGSLTIDNGSADMPASPGAGGKLSKKERKRAAAAAANAAAVGDRDEDDDEEKGEEDVEEDESVAGAPGKSAAGSRKGDKKGRRKGKKGRGGGDAGDEDDDEDVLDQGTAAASVDDASTDLPVPPPSGKLSKKDRRRAEAAAVAAAAAAAVVEDEDGEGGGGDEEEEGDDPEGAVEAEQPAAATTTKSKSKKGDKKSKKKGGKGRRGEEDEDGEDEDELSRGISSLSVDDLGAERADTSAGRKLSSKERRRAEAATMESATVVKEADEEVEDGGDAEGDRAKAAAMEEEKAAKSAKAGKKGKKGRKSRGDDDEDKGVAAGEEAGEVVAEAEKEAAEAAGVEADRVVDEKRGQEEAESEAARKAAKAGKEQKKGGDEDGGSDADAGGAQGRRTSKKDRKKSRQQAEAEEPEKGDASSPPPSNAKDSASEAVVQGSVAIGAGATAAAAEPAPVEAKKPKKEKKSKLQRKLEEAARLKAEAEAAAGVTAAEAAAAKAKEQAAIAEQDRKKKEEAKAAKKAAKEAAKEKESKVKSILEDLDDVEYYGSDHEEQQRRGKGSNGASKVETVEEELARLVAKAEASGKTVTGRQRKKILQEVEARRRAMADEQREELAHREGAQFGCSQTAVGDGDHQWANSLDITIDAFSISAHDKTLFKDSSLQVVHGRKYGLVGPNGAGKSTLLKMIASGELKIPPKIDCLYVEQEVVADETPAVIAVMKADKVRWGLMEEERKINRELRDDPENDKLNDRLQQIHEELHSTGGDNAEAQARRILFGLGFDDNMQVKATKNFSGGWRMRISLARALFMAPTLLMLDEPTNHLDLNAVIWLDDYLQKWKKTLLVVSHDQDFLNSVCEEILHLDHKRINQYKGNYDQFKEMEAQKRKQQAKEWEKQQKKLAALKRGGQSRGKAEDTVKKSKFREPGGSKKKKSDAVAAGTGEVETAQLVERPREYVVTLHFPEVSILSPPVIEVLDVDFRYPTGPMILKNVNFGLDQTSRICIVGPNGAGKTTLLKLLTGDLEATEGFVRRNPRMRAGIYNQHFVDRLPMDIDPTTYLREKFSDQCDYQSARNLLGRFGLEGHAHTIKMRDLSGGQKARVVFCELSLQAPHVLFLDEPTNNLDIESIDALCTAITEFNGGVVVVTHDARLIESTDCRLWIVDEQEVTPWEGEFDGYREDLLRKLEEKLAAQEQARLEKAGKASST